MGKNKLIIISSSSILILILLATLITMFVESIKNDIIEKDNNLIFINDILQDITIDSEDDIILEDKNDIIGTIEIPKIDLEASIKETVELDILAEYVGHFTNSSIWDGNVCLASHNRGSSVAHYFEKINELVQGDIIIYKTKLGIKNYEVSEIKEIDSTDWSITENNGSNLITLITCITGEPSKRLCVIGKEKNN